LFLSFSSVLSSLYKSSSTVNSIGNDKLSSNIGTRSVDDANFEWLDTIFGLFSVIEGVGDVPDSNICTLLTGDDGLNEEADDVSVIVTSSNPSLRNSFTDDMPSNEDVVAREYENDNTGGDDDDDDDDGTKISDIVAVPCGGDARGVGEF
jgi:hypothetical protein